MQGFSSPGTEVIGKGEANIVSRLSLLPSLFSFFVYFTSIYLSLSEEKETEAPLKIMLKF